MRLAMRLLVVALLCLWPLRDGDAGFAIFQAAKISVAPVCPDSVPGPAAAFGFNTCIFYDSMQSSSTFDLNATNQPGFNWYLSQPYHFASFVANQAGNTLTVTSVDACCENETLQVGQTIGYGGTGTAPDPGATITALGTGTGGTGTYTVSGASKTFTGSTLTAAFVQPSNTLSFSGAGVTLLNVGQGTNNYGIGTVGVMNFSGGAGGTQGYHGTTFKNGMLWRTHWAWDESLSPGRVVGTGCNTGLNCLRWPAAWTTSWPGTAYGGNFQEVDIIDAFPQTTTPGIVDLGNHLHDFHSGTFFDDNFSGINRPNICSPAMNGTTFFALDFLYVPTAKNGGGGIFAIFWDPQNCGGNAAMTAHISGTTLTIDSGLVGSLGTNSHITGNNVQAGTVITGGSGVSWTVNNSQTVSSEVLVASNMNSCVYYLSPGQAACAGTPFAGIFNAQELGGNGFQLLYASGCTAYTGASQPSTSCNVNTSAGNWPFKLKDIQVWGAQLADKVVQ